MASVHVLRGRWVESSHEVHAAVVRANGDLFAWVGNPELKTFWRSSAKPFQALAFERVLNQLKLDERHLAIACASHNGEDLHVEIVQDLLAHIHVDASALRCGTHAPFDRLTRNALQMRGERASVLRHNCSGKHAGMIAVCVAKGWSFANYEQIEHPIQQEIKADLQDLAGEPLEVAIDGCSVPSFFGSVYTLAKIFAQLAQPTPPTTPLTRIYEAMRANAYLIAGRERIDTELMGLPAVVSKIGAEAVIGLALRNTPYGPVGLALKIADGGERARDVAVARLLDRLGVASELEEPLARFAHPILHNNAGIEVGEIRATFELER